MCIPFAFAAQHHGALQTHTCSFAAYLCLYSERLLIFSISCSVHAVKGSLLHHQCVSKSVSRAENRHSLGLNTQLLYPVLRTVCKQNCTWQTKGKAVERLWGAVLRYWPSAFQLFLQFTPGKYKKAAEMCYLCHLISSLPPAHWSKGGTSLGGHQLCLNR